MLLKWKNTNFTNIKEPISIDNIDDNEIEVCNKTFFSKNFFSKPFLKILLAIKMLKKLDLYAYSSQKLVIWKRF